MKNPQPVPVASRLPAQEGRTPYKTRIITPLHENEEWAGTALLRLLAQEKGFPIHLMNKQGRLIGVLIDIGPDGRPVYVSPDNISAADTNGTVPASRRAGAALEGQRGC